MIVLLVRLVELGRHHLRHLTAMGRPTDQQFYWSRNHSTWWPWIKKQIIYAPLWKKRHNREFRLSSAVNVGTLPSRFHTVFLAAYLLSNIAFCALLDYTVANRYAVVAQLRGRSGTLAVANMIPLFLFAGRNNPLIPLLQVSFDTYNLLHRWIGRMVVIESIVHTLAWLFNQIDSNGMSSVAHKINTDPFIGWGMVSTVAMILILTLSPSPLRHAFYETFLNLHIILVVVTLAGIWIHCDLEQLPQFPYLKVIVALWVGDRGGRLARILHYNYSAKHWTNATVVALPGDACRVTLHLPKRVHINPGSHAYLRFASVRPWETHPFSIAWVEHNQRAVATPDSLPTTEKPPSVLSMPTRDTQTSVSFVIHAQTGLTRTLYDAALAASPGRLRTRACFEGPYGGHHSLASYGHVILFAGSSGITHQIPYISSLLQSYAQGTCATRKLTFIWIVRDLDHLEWVRPWFNTLLALPGRREFLTIKLFVTRPKCPSDVISASQTVQMFPGRPDVRTIIETELEMKCGAACVTVCGPGSLADSVREVVRECQTASNVDFIEESFTW
jgi:predicted ferric reductase